MDYLNTDLDYQAVRIALARPDASEEQQLQLHEMEAGYQQMTEEYGRIIEKAKHSVFRLFRRRMTEESPHANAAFRLGLMMALKDQGVSFQVKEGFPLTAKMAVKERQEHRQEAIRLANLDKGEKEKED